MLAHEPDLLLRASCGAWVRVDEFRHLVVERGLGRGTLDDVRAAMNATDRDLAALLRPLLRCAAPRPYVAFRSAQAEDA